MTDGHEEEEEEEEALLRFLSAFKPTKLVLIVLALPCAICH